MKIKIFTVISLALLLMNNACTDNFEELNTPNNLVTEDLVNIDLMLTLVQRNSVIFGSNGHGTIGNYCGMSVSNANRPFAYGDSPGVWNSAYRSYLNNLSEIIRLTQMDSETAPDLVNKKAIARIMKAWVFSKVTDTYGDIPYSESCLSQDQAVFNPKYDSQKSIYEDLFKELKEAAAELDNSKESYGSADLMYGGDVAKWAKLANSLRLRLALRVRYADAALATANMSDLTEANLITTRDDDAYGFSVTDYQENRNGLYNSLSDRGYPHTSHYPGKTIIDLLNDNNDPRTKVFFDTAKAEFPGTTPGLDYFGYRGHPVLGKVPVEEKYPYGAEACSRWTPFWWSPEIERPIIKCSEVYFSLAEAALFGIKGTSADANHYYQLGIDKAIEWAAEFYETSKPQMSNVLYLYYSLFDNDWTEDDANIFFNHKEMTQAEIDAFKASAAYTLSGTQEQQLEQIMNQKMIAIFPLEYQGWADWRRTGYPRVLVGTDGDNLMGVSPRRMPWPNSEQTVNSDSYAKALEQIGGTDGRLVKIWWDANPAAPHEHPGTVESMDTTWVSAGK